MGSENAGAIGLPELYTYGRNALAYKPFGLHNALAFRQRHRGGLPKVKVGNIGGDETLSR